MTAALLITGCTPFTADPLSTSQQQYSHTAASALTASTIELDTPTSAEQHSISSATAALARQLTEAHRISGSADTESEDYEGPESVSQVFSGAPQREIRAWADAIATAYHAAQERDAAEERAAAEQARQELQAQERAAEEEAQQRAAEEAAEERAAEQSQQDPAEDPQPAPDSSTAPPPSPAPAPSTFNGNLGAYLSQLASSYPGEISISVAEIGGQGRRASTGGTTRYTTASTYKLFLAYSILRRVEDGTVNWNDHVTGGRNVEQCFQDMVVLSDNPCPEALGPQLGWPSIYADARAAGARGTGPGEGNSGIKTTADDLTSLLVRLETGQLGMSAASHERLRGALAANIHRQGIAAGSSGQVLNKPGFINGYLHDAAIIRHPHGSYVISIMSQGSTWSALSGITRDVEMVLGYR